MPTANIIANTADAEITSQTTSSSWAATRDASAGTTIQPEDALAEYAITNRTDSNYRIDRIFLYFDLSTIPIGATINSVTLTGKTNSDWTNDSGLAMVLTAGTPADPDAIVVGDFDQFGTTSFASTTPSGGNVDFTFALNASGVAHVQSALGAKCNFVILTSADFNNLEVGTPVTNQFQIYSADTATASLKPTLNVTYTNPESSSPSLSLSPSSSASPSSSISRSPSQSASPSASVSPSASISLSPSSSLSPSDAPGSGFFSKQASAFLPSGKANLSIIYHEEEEENIEVKDGHRVSISSFDS